MKKEREMFSLIELWEESNEPQAAFCATHGVSLSKFGYWRSKWLDCQTDGATASKNAFIPILAEQKKAQPAVESSCYEIIYSNGVCLRLPGLDLSLLPQLLSLDV